MGDAIPLTTWGFRRFQSARSGKWRLLVLGDAPGRAGIESSAVSAIDIPTRVVTTASGSLYRLDGPWMYGHLRGAPQEVAAILDWYGEWVPWVEER